jgi:CBS domain-containing protein
MTGRSSHRDTGRSAQLQSEQETNGAIPLVDAATPISEVCTTKLVTAFPDETVTEVLPRIFDYQLGQIIIVDPQDPSQMLGLLVDRNIIKAWKLAYRHGEKSLLSAYHLRDRGGRR